MEPNNRFQARIPLQLLQELFFLFGFKHPLQFVYSDCKCSLKCSSLAECCAANLTLKVIIPMLVSWTRKTGFGVFGLVLLFVGFLLGFFLKHMVGKSVFCEISVCSVAVIKMSNFKLMNRTEKSIIKLKWAVLLEWFLGLNMMTWVELTA